MPGEYPAVPCPKNPCCSLNAGSVQRWFLYVQRLPVFAPRRPEVFQKFVCIQVKLLQGTIFTQTLCCGYTCPDYECKLYTGWSLDCLSRFLVVFPPHQHEQIDEKQRRQEQCAWKRKPVLRSHYGSPSLTPMTSHHPDCQLYYASLTLSVWCGPGVLVCSVGCVIMYNYQPWLVPEGWVGGIWYSSSSSFLCALPVYCTLQCCTIHAASCFKKNP